MGELCAVSGHTVGTWEWEGHVLQQHCRGAGRLHSCQTQTEAQGSIELARAGTPNVPQRLGVEGSVPVVVLWEAVEPLRAEGWWEVFGSSRLCPRREQWAQPLFLFCVPAQVSSSLHHIPHHTEQPFHSLKATGLPDHRLEAPRL